MRLVTSRRNVFYLPGKHDVVNGQIVYDHGKINGDIRGEMLTFY